MERLMFTPPVSVQERTSANGTIYWVIEDVEGRQASTFNRAVAEHLRQAAAPVECEVELNERDGKRYRTVRAIPGVVERQQRPGGGGRPLLSDQQVALLAAAIGGAGDGDDILATAEAFRSWLAGVELKGKQPAPASPQRPAAGAGRPPSASSSAPAPPLDLRDALALAFPGRPQMAERWLATRLREAVASSVEELTAEQRETIIAELLELAKRRES